jgi:uncharacterized protein (DUF433 family)
MPSTDYRYLVNMTDVREGNTIVEDTRIGVHDVIGLIVKGFSVDDVVRSFPDLTRAQVYEVFNYAREHGLILITCNRDDFLSLAAKRSSPGIVILVGRRSRHVECGHLLTLLKRAGESG